MCWQCCSAAIPRAGKEEQHSHPPTPPALLRPFATDLPGHPSRAHIPLAALSWDACSSTSSYLVCFGLTKLPEPFSHFYLPVIWCFCSPMWSFTAPSTKETKWCWLWWWGNSPATARENTNQTRKLRNRSVSGLWSSGTQQSIDYPCTALWPFWDTTMIPY